MARYGMWLMAATLLLLLVQTQMQQREIRALEGRIDSVAGAAATREYPRAAAPRGGIERAARDPLNVPDDLEVPPQHERSVRGAVPITDRYAPAAAIDQQEFAARVGGDRTLERSKRTAGLRDALVEVLEAQDPELQDRLRAVVKDQRELERDSRREKRQTRWEEDTLSRLGTLSQQVGLDQSQQDSLFAILSRARDLTGEAFRAAREDHSFGEAREKASSLRQEADGEARELLSDKQYAAYEQMRDEEMDRRGTRRRH